VKFDRLEYSLDGGNRFARGKDFSTKKRVQSTVMVVIKFGVLARGEVLHFRKVFFPSKTSQVLTLTG
jgi:hypothetical protein